MAISPFDLCIESFAPMLRSLSGILDKAAEQKRDADALVSAQLAPDMFPLAKQVQIACDHAKTAVALLMGVTAPVFADNEKTLEELKARIARTLQYLEGASEEKFAGAESRKIEVPGPPGMTFEFTGLGLLRDWSLPHFYFHLVTAYDILRHNGVEIGKRDYLSNAGKYLRQG